MKTALAALLSVVLVGCGSVSPQRYSAVPDMAPVMKALPARTITLSPFTMSATYSSLCRQASTIDPPVNLTFPEYFRTAMADELKVAGLYSTASPQVTLSGDISRLNFSSTKNLTQGEWDIELVLKSSNGSTMSVSELYPFESGFEGMSACRRTAEALLPALQNVVRKSFESKEFRRLLD